MGERLFTMPKRFPIGCASAALCAAGFILAAGPAAAQQYDPYYQSAPRPQTGGLLDHVQQDLDRAAGQPYLSPIARGKIEHARQKIWEFQRKWASGRFDKGALDDAIGNIKRAVNNPTTDYRDRRILADDLAGLRAFRANRGFAAPGYGYR
jgi:hypothetical protein